MYLTFSISKLFNQNLKLAETPEQPTHLCSVPSTYLKCSIKNLINPNSSTTAKMLPTYELYV